MQKVVPDEILEDLPIRLEEVVNVKTQIKGFSSIAGGCINNGGKLATNAGNYFLKWNSKSKYPGMFDCEKAGLEDLASTNTVLVPKAFFCGEVGSFQYLLMEFIETGRRTNDYWEALGAQVAQLHKHSNASFGYHHDNYIGSLPQLNHYTSSWIEFFTTQRIQPLLDMLSTSIRINISDVSRIEKIYAKLDNYMPVEKPALLHGDLWSGNVLASSTGSPVLIDPAVYYGHREAELAFTKLFGGFNEAFYHAYENNFPTESGLENRIDLYNLYPLLVHANLFGDSYLMVVKRIINYFL